MEKYKVTAKEEDDGREDVHIKINGHVLLTMPQEGYQALGITYEQAKGFIRSLGQMMLDLAEMHARESYQAKGEKNG